MIQLDEETRSAILNTLAKRCQYTENLVTSIVTGSGKMDPETIANMILQMTLNQLAVLRSLCTLLATPEERKAAQEKQEDSHA